MTILTRFGRSSYTLKSADSRVLAYAQALGFERYDSTTYKTKRPSLAYHFIQYAEKTLQDALRGAKETFLMSRSLRRVSGLVEPSGGLHYLDYQSAGIDFILNHPHTLLADPPGLGKTIQVIGALNQLKMKKVFIACPASLRLNWLQELEKWLVYKPEVLTVMSLDSCWRKEQFAKIYEEDYGFMAVDEAHYIKNANSKRSNTIGMMAQKTPYRVCITGTPIKNHPMDAYNIINTVDPYIFPQFMPFALRYCDAQQREIYVRKKGAKYATRKMVWDYTGSSHEDELQEILRSTIMVRRSKEEALPQLPRKRRQIIEVDMGKKAVKAENKAWETVCRDIGYDEALKQMEAGAGVAFTEMAAVRKEVAMTKVDAVVEHVSNILDAGEKVILFAHHRDVISALKDGLFAYNPVVYVGGMNERQKDAAKKTFMTDDTCRVFIGNIVAAGTGLTLTVSSTVVFAEMSFCPSEMEQCEDRACRIGQTADSVLVQHIVLAGSLDVEMCKKLIEKQRIADEILDI